MNLYELKGKREIEKEYQSKIPQIIAEIKNQAMIDLSTDIELVKAEAANRIADIVDARSKDLIAKLDSIKTLKGDKGDDGIAPTLETIVASVIPHLKHGETPTDERLLSLIAPLIRKPKNGRTPTDEKLISLIRPMIAAMLPDVFPAIVSDDSKLPEVEDLLKKHAKILVEHAVAIKKASVKRGGGDSVVAGSGISITRVGGRKVISALVTSSGSIIPATNSGDDQNYDLNQAATTSSYYAIINGGSYQADDDDFPFSVSGTLLTFDSPLPSDIANKKIKLVCV